MAKYKGARVFTTAGPEPLMFCGLPIGALEFSRSLIFMHHWSWFSGSQEKLAACKDLGADVVINYKTEDFVAWVKEETEGKGVCLHLFFPSITKKIIETSP